MLRFQNRVLKTGPPATLTPRPRAPHHALSEPVASLHP